MGDDPKTTSEGTFESTRLCNLGSLSTTFEITRRSPVASTSRQNCYFDVHASRRRRDVQPFSNVVLNLPSPDHLKKDRWTQSVREANLYECVKIVPSFSHRSANHTRGVSEHRTNSLPGRETSECFQTESFWNPEKKP